ncbi:mannosyltransferase family protein [Frigoribacterium sp. PhB116]|uniref:mannosyltransferase family protein n=1 Tax=Frigoribacterium sp. PhB116 TaxID=2485174 RepID=UPI00105E1C55|nr:mannosyltransferase family protein [Frigoribacterium sp. PhB116]TDT63928.1 mannosyltransferase PIG-V [Frigoribacterium sp. PhB116]
MTTGTEARRSTQPEPPAPGTGALALPRPGLATTLVLLGVYAASRLVTTLFLAVVHALTATATWAQHDGGPGFTGYLSSWDAAFYREISEQGYPVELPRDDEGRVAKNAWAFMPLFPALVRVVRPVVGGDWLIAAIVVAVLAGAGATLVLHRLMLTRFGARASFWGAVSFCVAPMSFVLQVPYAESLFLLLMFGALLAMTARRWAWFTVLGVLASVAHPGALALSAALGLTWLVRLVRDRRARRGGVENERLDDSTPLAEHVRIWAAGLVVTAAGFAWPVVVAVVTGERDGYFATESSWWRDYIGSDGFVPFTPWFRFGEAMAGWLGVVAVVLLLAVVVLGLVRRSQRLGLELQTYAIGYVAYLVAVFLPQQSSFRMLMPLAPLLGDPQLSATRRRVVVTIVAGLALQVVAIVLLWTAWPP